MEYLFYVWQHLLISFEEFEYRVWVRILCRLVKLLISYGANVNATDSDGRTALWHAGSVDSHFLMEVLLKNGARVDPRDSPTGMTPLAFASCYGNLKAVRTLLDCEANTETRDNHGRTPLTAAAYCFNYHCAKALLEAGADVNAVDHDLMTPLAWAVRDAEKRFSPGYGRPDTTIKLLLDTGANMDAPDKDGNTPRSLVQGNPKSKWIAELFDHYDHK